MNFSPEILNLSRIFFASVFSENIALAYFLGMCAFISISKSPRMAFNMGITVFGVNFITTLINWGINRFVLIPLNLEFLQFLVFILVIAFIVQILEMIVERFFPVIYEEFGIFLPLITVNCAILGASLFAVLREYNLNQATVFALGSGIGWTLAITLLSGIRHHLVFSRPSRKLGNVGMTMVIAAFLAMAFAGFGGIFPKE